VPLDIPTSAFRAAVYERIRTIPARTKQSYGMIATTMGKAAAARARGRQGGRPRLLAGAKKLAMVQAMYNDKNNTIQDICQTLHISRATLYLYLRANRTLGEASVLQES
jgi:predicted transcriptional regulator YheO